MRFTQGLVLGLTTVILSLAWSQPSFSQPTLNEPIVKSNFKSKFSNFSTPVETPLHLVIRLRDRRVYVYHHQQLLASYPIAIGREGWETPTGQHQVIQMVRDPVWQHPFTGELVPPGPENPLGTRWIAFWTDGTNYIGFHGTPNEETVGQAISHGCVRMFNQDVLALFEKVQVGTPVTVEP